MKITNERVILIIAIILGSLVWILLISNFLDETLRPEVQEALDWHLPDAAYEDNGYIVLLGMNEPAGADAIAAGKQVLENELLRFQAYKLNRVVEPTPPHSSSSSVFSMKDSLCDYQKQFDCVEFYLAQEVSVWKQLIEYNQFLLDRYRIIRNSQNYVETSPPFPESRIPYFTNMLNAAKLEHVLVIKDITEERFSDAMNRLAENSVFAKTLLKKSDTLISHMVALHMVKNDAMILSSLMHKYPQLVQYTEQISQILSPIFSREFSVGKSLRWEQKNTLNLLRHARAEYNENWGKKGQDYLIALFDLVYNENATLNLAYDLYNLKVSVADAEAYKLDVEVTRADLEREKLLGVSLAHLIYVKNSGGKLLLQISEPNYLDYVIRQHDIDGYLRLVALQYKLMAAKFKAQDVAGYLEKSGKEYSNPYTQKSMKWSVDKLELSFEGRQTDKNDPSKKVRYAAYIPH